MRDLRRRRLVLLRGLRRGCRPVTPNLPETRRMRARPVTFEPAAHAPAACGRADASAAPRTRARMMAWRTGSATGRQCNRKVARWGPARSTLAQAWHGRLTAPPRLTRLAWSG